MLVSDIGMPEEDGYSLIAKIRQLRAARQRALPAIALTAYVADGDRMQALDAGFQMHVAKPVEPTELIAAIAVLTGRAQPE